MIGTACHMILPNLRRGTCRKGATRLQIGRTWFALIREEESMKRITSFTMHKEIANKYLLMQPALRWRLARGETENE